MAIGRYGSGDGDEPEGPTKIKLTELHAISDDLDDLARKALAQATWDILTEEEQAKAKKLWDTSSFMRGAYLNPKELAYNQGLGKRSETKELLHKILGRLADLDYAIKAAEL